MWVYALLITVFAVVPDQLEVLQRTKLLNVFNTPEVCESEKTRITGDMAKSYPGEKPDYVIECKKVEKQSIKPWLQPWMETKE